MQSCEPGYEPQSHPLVQGESEPSLGEEFLVKSCLHAYFDKLSLDSGNQVTKTDGQ